MSRFIIVKKNILRQTSVDKPVFALIIADQHGGKRLIRGCADPVSRHSRIRPLCIRFYAFRFLTGYPVVIQRERKRPVYPGIFVAVKIILPRIFSEIYPAHFHFQLFEKYIFL